MWWWVLSAGVVFLLYKASCRAPTKLTQHTLKQDLNAWLQVLGPRTNTEALFQRSDVIHYYRNTTNRDYAWLRRLIGPGMHTVLTAPAPVQCQAMGARQAMFVLAEVCSIKARRVLEIGCGRGYCTLLLAGLMPDVHFDAIDLLDDHIQVARSDAREAGISNVHFTVGDAEACGHLIGTYDVIFGVESLCYMKNIPLFLRRIRGSLRSGGHLVMVDGFRSHTFSSCSSDQRAAMRHAERGFCINAMQSKAYWCRWATFCGWQVVRDLDLTMEAIPFWTTGCWWTRWILSFPCLLRWYGQSSDCRRATVGNLCGITMVAHAMSDRGAAEYGMLVFRR